VIMAQRLGILLLKQGEVMKKRFFILLLVITYGGQAVQLKTPPGGEKCYLDEREGSTGRATITCGGKKIKDVDVKVSCISCPLLPGIPLNYIGSLFLGETAEPGAGQRLDFCNGKRCEYR
jgi:hypothetical protein